MQDYKAPRVAETNMRLIFIGICLKREVANKMTESIRKLIKNNISR